MPRMITDAACRDFLPIYTYPAAPPSGVSYQKLHPDPVQPGGGHPRAGISYQLRSTPEITSDY